MKTSYYFLLLVLLWSCSEEDPLPPFESRETVQEFLDREMILQSVLYQDTFQLVLKDPSAEFYVSPVDTILLFNEVRKNGRIDMFLEYQGGILSFVRDKSPGLDDFLVKVSGEVKKGFLQDSLPGLPILLTKVEFIAECSDGINFSDVETSLEKSSWVWKGFVDELGEIYSFPSCQVPNPSFTLTNNLVNTDEYPYISIHAEDAMFIQFEDFYLFFFSRNEMPVYELLNDQLVMNVAVPTRYLSPAHQNAGYSPFYSTVYTANKGDSLVALFRPPTVLNFMKEGNQLILSNPEIPLRALFVSE